MSVRSVLIGAAVFAAAFGLLGWWMSRRKGLPAVGVTTVLGIAGVYTGFWGVLEHRYWLYLPSVLLILASYAIEFAASRRSARKDNITEGPDTAPRRE